MKKIEIEVPDGKRAEWVEGVLRLVDDLPVVFGFEVGDAVVFTDGTEPLTVTARHTGDDGEPAYTLDGHKEVSEKEIRPYTQDMTKAIKTFNDAVEWCRNNGMSDLVDEYDRLRRAADYCLSEDVRCYLELRIIVCALNEAWYPDEEDRRYIAYYCDGTGDVLPGGIDGYYCDSSTKLCFRNSDLAVYAAEQFADIYKGFCRVTDL